MSPNGTTRSTPTRPTLVPQPALAEIASADTLPRARQWATVTGAFRSLRHRNYRLYFLGQLVSLTGTWMQTTALMWLAYELTHQSLWTALVSAAQILPTFFFGFWGGALADRCAKRSLLIATQTILLLLAFVLAGLVLLGAVEPWQLLVIMLANGLVQAVDFPARLSFVMDMVGREDLMNAVALNALLFNVARALGPAVAGVLLLWMGPGLCFLANGLSYLAVVWALFAMDITGTAHGMATGRGLHALFAGVEYLASKPALAVLILLAGTVALCGWPFLTLLPALAQDTLQANESGYSWMLSATGIGALVAAFTVAAFGSIGRRRSFIGGGVLIVIGALLGLAVARTLPLAVACCALLGFGLILFFATSQSMVQLSTENHNRGKIMGIWAMVLGGSIPLGNLLVGPAADHWGEPLVLGLEGLACAAVAVGLLVLLVIWRHTADRRLRE